jgi:hypothetical protein
VTSPLATVLAKQEDPSELHSARLTTNNGPVCSESVIESTKSGDEPLTAIAEPVGFTGEKVA